MRGRLHIYASLAATILGLAAVAPAHAETPCASMPGLEAVLKTPAHIIWFGEIHGTTEAPAFFGDAVCTAGQGGRQVVVVLERLKEDDQQTQAFLAIPDKDDATSVLLSGVQWRSRLQDGRNSVAMLALMQRLRDYKAAGRVADIVLMDDWSEPDNRDAAMADAVKTALAKHPGARILVYSGNMHAKKPPSEGAHAAGYLAADDVYTVNVQIEGGTAWSPEKGVVAVLGFPHRAAGIFRAADTGLPPPATLGFDAIAFLGVPVTASKPALEDALALTVPVHDAFAKIDAEQATLPPPASDRERLERMFDVDQAGRKALERIDVARLPKIQQAAAQMMMWEDEIGWRDRADQKALKAMMPATGWFTRSTYGRRASDAAFLVVQHAVNDPDLMRDVLKRMTPLVGTGEIDDQQYALLYDRVSLQFDHKPQRYGSQVVCRAGHWQADTLDDPDHVDERRKTVGMIQTEAEYLKYFETMPCH